MSVAKIRQIQGQYQHFDAAPPKPKRAMGFARGLLLGLAALARAAPAAPCTGSQDCSYNGQCSPSGACECTPAWKGASCSELDRLPVRRGTGYQRVESGRNISSWGAAVLQHRGVWYAWISEMVQHCGIDAWSRNSQVVLATSADPLTEPFVRQSVFSPVFSHEPDAIRGPVGEVVVMLTHATSLPTPGPGGPICTTCVDGATAATCGEDKSYRLPAKEGRAFPTLLMHSSRDPTGAFSTPIAVFNGSAGQPRGGTYGDTNLAGVILPNGSFVGIWRECTRRPNCYGKTGDCVHPVRASDWKDPSSYDWSTEGAKTRSFSPFPRRIMLL